jgi:uncharacterized protein
MKPTSAQRLLSLHGQTDARFQASTAKLPVVVGCGSGCFGCCVDEITVWQSEADRIATYVRAAKVSIEVGAVGGCALLLNGRCQVYAARPYVCRSQGAVLAFFDGEQDRRDTCPEHLEGLDLAALPESAVFELGPAEQELASIASQELGERRGRGLPERVSLRELATRLAKSPVG